MSRVLEFGGRRLAAGLLWMEPGAEAEREARSAWGWSLEWGEQIAWVPKESGLKGVEGVESLAVSVATYLGSSGADGSEGGWIAVLKSDDGHVAVVRARDGAIGTGGDEVFDDAGSAMGVVGVARDEGADVYAMAGVVTDSGFVVEVDVASLPELGREVGLKRRGSGGGSRLRVVGLCGAFLVVIVGGVWVLAPELLMGLFGGREKRATAPVIQAEADVFARIDNGALVQACGEAQGAWPPYMQAWKLISIECYGWFVELDFVGLRPELEGRAVMVVRWKLPSHYVAPVHRRIAEEHLGAWYLGSVVETSAWAVVPLGPVLELAEGDKALSYLAFRREVDRHFGMQGGRIEYGGGDDGVAVTVYLSHALSSIGELVADVPGFELISLSRSGQGGWVLKARQVAGFEVKESLFRELARVVRESQIMSF